MSFFERYLSERLPEFRKEWERSDRLALEPVEDKSDDKQLDHSANLALRVVELERVVKRLSDILIKHDVELYRLKHETEYLDETWRSTREVQLAMSDELEAIKCEK